MEELMLEYNKLISNQLGQYIKYYFSNINSITDFIDQVYYLFKRPLLEIVGYYAREHDPSLYKRVNVLSERWLEDGVEVLGWDQKSDKFFKERGLPIEAVKSGLHGLLKKSPLTSEQFYSQFFEIGAVVDVINGLFDTISYMVLKKGSRGNFSPSQDF